MNVRYLAPRARRCASARRRQVSAGRHAASAWLVAVLARLWPAPARLSAASARLDAASARQGGALAWLGAALVVVLVSACSRGGEATTADVAPGERYTIEGSLLMVAAAPDAGSADALASAAPGDTAFSTQSAHARATAASSASADTASTAAPSASADTTAWPTSAGMDRITVIVDQHGSARCDTIEVSEGRFAYEGHTHSDIDELWMSLPDGTTWTMYAEPGRAYRLSLAVDTLTRSAVPAFEPADSLNGWLVEQTRRLSLTACPEERLAMMDSLCRAGSGDVRTALLLRDQVPLLDDSLGVRRLMGRLAPQARPEWLTAAIDRLLDGRGVGPKRGERLKMLPDLAYWADSSGVYSLRDSRVEMVLLYFWADYAPASVDSLRMLTDLARQYGLGRQHLARFDRAKGRQPRRIDLISICVHHGDSATWRAAVEGLPGRHCLLAGGLSHPALLAWQVTRLPHTMVLDRFSSLLAAGVWGSELRGFLDRATVNRDQPEPSAASHDQPARPSAAVSGSASAAACRRPAPSSSARPQRP